MLSNGSQTGSLSSLDALPKQFVLSMKKLFDILDDKHSGYVRYADIEKGWQDDGSKGLPQGVLDSLRRVTPPSGLLSFERFCAGLKLCLLRNQQQTQAQIQVHDKLIKPPRPPSAPQLLGLAMDSGAPTAKVRPRSQMSPELEHDEDYGTPAPPPKPPRQSTTGPPLAKADIRNALQNWQLSLMHTEQRAAEACAKQKSLKTAREQFEHRGSADGGSSSTSATDYALGGLTLALPPKKSNNKRRESRRHTLQHGIDYNMLKRLKQLEEQRELLLFGLDGVEKARDFYMQQVLNVQEQIKYFGRLGTRFEQWSELQQERLNYQRARVLEANRSLALLTDTWDHGGYPLHINLALPRKSLQHFNFKPYASNDAELLACEKQALMSELYEQQQQHTQFHNLRNMSDFVLSQPSPVSQSSAGLGDADVVY
ncbi:suppressor APC domain-containing protein 2 [Drosophila novamexicana]|uniref:suppressor APC domain-containing protein 2 n=1 Tax=Drosophila novamexicana TaxID=47314 RepID=UPI0011E5C1D9|nr:suppressor APC domain-containing protein 2 [Drosophila novamexicana]